MIAKAAPISHGSNAIRYTVNKDMADVIKSNLLPEGLSAEGIYQCMMIHCKQFETKVNRGSPLKNHVIRIEVSPSAEETKGWTLDDWRKLVDEFIRTFDAIDLSKKAKRKSAKSTNIQNSQYVVALHRDAQSGILHLHIDVCRIDKDGNVNCGNLIGERAMMAANIINEERGWMQPVEISKDHMKEISGCCMGILRSMPIFDWNVYAQMVESAGYGINLQRDAQGNVKGYSIVRGNSKYRASSLGTGRELAPSKIKRTWEKLHRSERNTHPARPSKTQMRTAAPVFTPRPTPKPEPKPSVAMKTASKRGQSMLACNLPSESSVSKTYDITTKDRRTWHVVILEDADTIIRQECSLEGAHPWAKIEEIQHTALLLFMGYIDAATSMSESSGGGGSSPESGWGRKDDEDDRDWARRCARMANRMCQFKRKRGIGM